MKIADISTPVVILRSFAHAGLCIARSLGSLGIPVYVADPDPRTPVLASRYCRGRFDFDFENSSSEDALEGMEAIANSIGRRCILIPTTDEGAIFIAEHAARLQKSFIFPERDAALIRNLSSKQHMPSIAEQAGIPTPGTLFPQSLDDVIGMAREIPFPVMLKGIDGQRMKKCTGKKMFIVHTAEELLEKYQLAEDPTAPNVMLQEYLPGGDDTVWMFNGYFEDGECLFGITGKKIHQCPVYSGSTSLGICLPNETVDSQTRAFMKAIRYNGVLDIGFRYDARDGKYKVLDVNPRAGATFRLFVDDHDLDAVRVFYLGMTAQPIVPGTPLHGRKWLVEDMDLVSSYRYRRDGNLSFVEWIKSFRGVREAAFWSAHDPRPFFRMLLNDIGELAKRIRRSGQPAPHSPTTRSCQNTYPVKEVYEMKNESFIAHDYDVPMGNVHTGDYLEKIGVAQIAPATCPFDPGYDPAMFEGHLMQSAHLMETIKISMACWQVCNERATRWKVAACKHHKVPTVTGGGPFEVAVQQGQLPLYLDLVADIGITRIEAGEGFTDMPLPPSTVMKMAQERGLEVQFELGKKHDGAFTSDVVTGLIEQGRRWLDAGALQLVIEARESALGVGLFDNEGKCNAAYADRFAKAFGLRDCIFEAPNKASQFALLNHFGREVHLCNVRLEEVLRVEIYRRGLHSDAFEHANLRPHIPEVKLSAA